VLGKIHRNATDEEALLWLFEMLCIRRWKTANCTEEDLTDDDKNALENMQIKIDAL